jgi:putative membrane protein
MENKLDKPTKEKQGHIILRDHLAAHRTELANDRTFYASVRTALAFLAVGASFIKFFGNLVMQIIGWIFIPVGIYIFIKGLRQFKKAHKIIEEEERNPSKISDIGFNDKKTR